MQRIVFSILISVIVCTNALAATSVTQHGITWTFETDYTVGQFVNGDYYVVNPGPGVKITGISPGYTGTPRAKNGSMVNPVYLLNQHGYDGYNVDAYSAALNVGIGISPSTPLTLASNSSLVSTISNTTPTGNDSYVKTAAVLTVLASAPPADSFRPGMCGTTKTVHSGADFDYSKLRALATPGGTTLPNMATYSGYLVQPFLDFSDARARFIHPSDGFPDNYYYGIDTATMALMLHMGGYTNEQKEDLLIRYIQFGIDLYSLVEGGPTGYLVTDGSAFYGWQPDGGFTGGRKWPILFAGIMLDYSPMKNIGQRSGDYLYSGEYGPGNPPSDFVYFGEDQLFYVTQYDVDITNGGSWDPDDGNGTPYPYTSAMIGMPEWGIRHSTKAYISDSAWTANYRISISNRFLFAGESMAARIMGFRSLWNQQSYFDYIDRYMAIADGDADPFGYTVAGQTSGNRPDGFIGAMFDTYRSQYNNDPPATGRRYRIRAISGD